ncbi:MAG: urea carboxylase-associated family protein, partial [Pseudomonadota bacterium]
MPSFGLELDRTPVRYRGLLDRGVRKFRVAAGGLELFRTRAGDLINITNKDGGASVWITSLRDDAKTCTGDALSSAASPPVDLPHGLFDSRRLKAIVTARNGSLADASAHAIFDEDAEAGDVFTLKVSADCLFIAISPLEQNYIVSGGGASFHIEHQPGPSAPSDALLPDPLGKVRDEWLVERGAAHAYQVKKGQFIQILDVEGQQCSDFMAMNGHALDTGNERFIDSTVSRSMARSAYPQPGLHDKFFDQDINPLLAVRQDTVGRHDTYAFACTARGYEERGFPGHINCSDNITDAYAPFGIKPRNAWPAINFFFNSWMDPHTHRMQADEAWSRPGDYVVMEALTDLVCVSTACPD